MHDFTLHMQRGERIGLIGESGSGKSMTTTALLGLLPNGVTASGSVKLGDSPKNLLEARDSELMKIRGNDIAMVFQEPLTALNPLMRAGDQVAEIMLQHRTVSGRGEAMRRAIEMLDAVKLPSPAEAARAYPHQLSGGQRQRVMLAMALANDPSLLFCDEPTTALDVTVQRQVLDLILELVRERGTGLLFITHDLAVVANMCTRVLVMNQGEIVEEGTTEQVFTHPQHPTPAVCWLPPTSRRPMRTGASSRWRAPRTTCRRAPTRLPSLLRLPRSRSRLLPSRLSGGLRARIRVPAHPSSRSPISCAPTPAVEPACSSPRLSCRL
ncbi:MAG: ABC transporter ATP-binding protein [Anaeromyxobacteraceae bacterium]